MNKKAFRITYINKRMGLSPTAYDKLNKAIETAFLEKFYDLDVNYVHSYLPLFSKGEVNTLPIIDWFKAKGSTIVIPKTNFTTSKMKHFIYDDNTVLRETKWGIKEPVDGKEINAELIDLVIVPLLVFDKFGHRVGYGKGFYDRFLSKCRRDTIKIGLSLFPQVDEIDDVNRYDVKLDYGIVPGKTVAFN